MDKYKNAFMNIGIQRTFLTYLLGFEQLQMVKIYEDEEMDDGMGTCISAIIYTGAARAGTGGGDFTCGNFD